MKLWQSIILVLLLLGGVFLFGYIKGHNKGESEINSLKNALNDTVNHYSVTIDGLKVFVAEKEQELMTEREAKKSEIIRNENLRKLNIKQANELSKLKLGIDTLIEDIDHNGEVVDVLNSQIVNYKSEIDSLRRGKAILLPFEFNKNDEWLSLKGKFDRDGKLDLKISLTADVDVTTGINKEKKPVCVVTTTNPYLKTVNVASYKFDTPKVKKYGLGIQVGYGYSGGNKGFSPYVGIGVSRIFVRL